MTNDNENPPMMHVVQYEMGPDGKLYTKEHSRQMEASSYLSMATAGSAIIRAATTGKRFRVRTIVVCNALAGTDKTVRLTDGSGLTYTKIKLYVGSGANNSMVSLENIQGLYFSSGIYVQASSFSTGMSVFIGGEVEPKETSV